MLTLRETVALAERSNYCAICGVELDWRVGGLKMGKIQPKSPSLDRINNDPFLTTSNVWVVCIKCNTTKNNRTMVEFVEYCKRVVEKFEGGS